MTKKVNILRAWRFQITYPGGLVFSSKDTVIINRESVGPGDDGDAFAKHMRDALAEWYPEAKITIKDYR